MPKGSAKPALRFKGFTDAWEQRKLSALYEKSSEKNDGSVAIDRNITVATMQFKSDVRVSTDDYLKTYYTFNLGDIAFEGHQSKEFRYGRFVENDIGNGIVSHIFAVFRPIVDYDLYFWKYAINNENLMRAILSRSTKASTMMHDLVTEDFLNETFLVPTLDEQQQIGAFFRKLDRLITLHQRKCSKLMEVKKSMLEKMFPKDGANVAEVRFKGFTEAWDKRKVEEITTSYSGGTPTVGVKMYYGGTIPFIRSAEINCDSTELFITEEGLKNSSAKLVSVGDILYALYGATGGEVGRAKLNGAINQAILAVKPMVNYDAEFISQWLRKNKQNIVESYLQGGQGNLSGEIVRGLVVDLPSYDEQIVIGKYFRCLDTLITLYQHKLEKLKNIKKACLEKMFA